MDIDERHCPNCGHDILNWDVPCPGCSQVPWNTPAGHRVIRHRRFWSTWSIGLPIAAVLLLMAGLIVIGNLSLRQHLRNQDVLARRSEAALLFGTSRFQGPWKLHPRYEEAVAPYELKVREAQADALEVIEMVEDPKQQEDAIRRLWQAWMKYEEAIQRLE